MKKLMEKLAAIPTDKWLHLLACLVVSCAFGSLIKPLVYDILLAPVMALFFTMLLGIGKEVYDSYQPNNTFDWKDLAFDFVGAVIGALLAIL